MRELILKMLSPAAEAEVGTEVSDADYDLIDAAEAGDTAAVRVLLGVGGVSGGASADAADEDGCSALFWAAHAGHADVIRVLHDGGARVDGGACDAALGTPLYAAARKGRTHAVVLLLELGATASSRTADGSTPLHIAACGGHDDAVRALCAGGARVDAARADGGTAAFAAAWVGHAGTIRTLHRHGADVNKPNGRGWSPAYIAVREGRADVLRALHECGVALGGELVVGGGWNLAHVAAATGRAELVPMLHAHGADLNLASRAGGAPVHIAAVNGHADVVAALHTCGADMRRAAAPPFRGGGAGGGESPTHLAAQNGHAGVLRALRAVGALGVGDMAVRGWTALGYAAWAGHAAAFGVLYEGGTAARALLLRAAAEGRSDVVRLLLGAGCPAAGAGESSDPVILSASAVAGSVSLGIPPPPHDRTDPVQVAEAHGNVATAVLLRAAALQERGGPEDGCVPVAEEVAGAEGGGGAGSRSGGGDDGDVVGSMFAAMAVAPTCRPTARVTLSGLESAMLSVAMRGAAAGGSDSSSTSSSSSDDDDER